MLKAYFLLSVVLYCEEGKWIHFYLTIAKGNHGANEEEEHEQNHFETLNELVTWKP